jgi:RNA polymerase sigma-70 factor (ECF subfamily)
VVIASEHELIQHAQSGDRVAFCQLAKSYERRVFSLALHYCRDPHDAEDLSQEVWLRAFKAIGSFRADASFYTWLRQITINTFLNDRRAASFAHGTERTRVRMESLSEMPDEMAAGPRSPQLVETEDGVHRHVLVERVMRALADLTPQQRLMFLLKHREGMTYQEIAVAFNCSTGNVKKGLFRAVLKLRSSLGLETKETPQVTLAAGENS